MNVLNISNSCKWRPHHKDDSLIYNVLHVCHMSLNTEYMLWTCIKHVQRVIVLSCLWQWMTYCTDFRRFQKEFLINRHKKPSKLRNLLQSRTYYDTVNNTIICFQVKHVFQLSDNKVWIAPVSSSITCMFHSNCCPISFWSINLTKTSSQQNLT